MACDNGNDKVERLEFHHDKKVDNTEIDQTYELSDNGVCGDKVSDKKGVQRQGKRSSSMRRLEKTGVRK